MKSITDGYDFDEGDVVVTDDYGYGVFEKWSHTARITARISFPNRGNGMIAGKDAEQTIMFRRFRHAEPKPGCACGGCNRSGIPEPTSSSPSSVDRSSL